MLYCSESHLSILIFDPNVVSDFIQRGFNAVSHSTLIKAPYRLHAVLVHEGQASAGHYWAYIYDHANQRWMKYNDISITESSWEELERDSFGGMTNASAYCLMYIDDRLPQLISGTALSYSV